MSVVISSWHRSQSWYLLGLLSLARLKTILIVVVSPPKPQIHSNKKAQFGVSSVRSFLVFVSLSYIMIFLVSLPRWRSRSSSGFPRVFDSSRRPQVAAKRIKGDCSGFRWCPRGKTKTKTKTKPWPATSCYLSPGGFSEASGPTRPFPAACWACMRFLFLCVWFRRGRCCCYVSSVYCLNKALGRYLVFTGAQRRPRQDRSSGEGGRRGPPWGSPASGPARSPRRCLWWTDGPCSSWLL